MKQESEPKMKGFQSYHCCFYPLKMEGGNSIPCGVAKRLHHEFNKEGPITENNHPVYIIVIENGQLKIE